MGSDTLNSIREYLVKVSFILKQENDQDFTSLEKINVELKKSELREFIDTLESLRNNESYKEL